MISRILAFFRKHDFDLNNPFLPASSSADGRKMNRCEMIGYKCKKCGYVLWPGDENMLSLPFKLERGCTGRRCKEEWEN